LFICYKVDNSIIWEDREYYAVLEQNILKLHKPDGTLYNWIISEGDLVGEDYIIF